MVIAQQPEQSNKQQFRKGGIIIFVSSLYKFNEPQKWLSQYTEEPFLLIRL